MKSMQVSIIIGMLLTMAACSTIPERKYTEINEAHIAIVESLLVAQRAGKISVEDWQNNVLPLIRTSDILLDRYKTSIRFGGTPDQKSLNKLGDVVDQMTKQLE